jgi:hypothetical protein
MREHAFFHSFRTTAAKAGSRRSGSAGASTLQKVLASIRHLLVRRAPGLDEHQCAPGDQVELPVEFIQAIAEARSAPDPEPFPPRLDPHLRA